MTKNCDLQWKALMDRKMKNIDVEDDQIEIIVEDDKPKAIQAKKEDAMTFWLQRIRTKQTVINVEENKDPTPAIRSAKLQPPAAKAALPIVAHKKEKERTSKEVVINVQAQAAKANVQKYKKSLFGATAQTKKQETKPVYVQSQESKKRRFQKQLAIIEEMNTPRWMHEKDKRQERNMFKYPISGNEHEYNYVRSKQSESFDNLKWIQFQRDREINRQKKREKELEARKQEKERRREIELEKRKRNEEELQDMLNGMLGIQPSKKQKMDENGGEEDSSKIKADVVKEAEEDEEEEQEEGDKQILATSDENLLNANQGNIDAYVKKPRVGLKDFVKPHYQSRAPGFINAILQHPYALESPTIETKRTPDIFEDISEYRRVFHYLIANECKAEVARRMVQLERATAKGNGNYLTVRINNYKTNGQGLTDVYIREVGKEGENPPIGLNNFSLSKYRLGLITSSFDFKKASFGFDKKTGHFSILVMLSTPETKEQLLQDIKAYGSFSITELQFSLAKLKSKEFFYYDMEKVTTHVREYLAVSNLAYCQLAPPILNPRILQNQMSSFVKNKQCLNDILEHLRTIFNETQFQSIRQMVFREKGIVLLQGPPGTGKTSTLMGLLSAQYEYLKKTKDNRKIMICAPSNSAVDHIAKRLINEGLFNGEGEIIKPVILRTGIVDTMDPDIRSVSLDQTCEKRMFALQAQANAQSKMTTPQIKQKLISIQKEIDKLQRSKQKQQATAKRLQYVRFQQLLYAFRSKKIVTSRKHFHRLQTQLLLGADIILTTLSSAGNEKLDRLRGEIACLIIDQAAQATEANLLIALQSGVEKVLLIGDPYQLPATCMSTDCNVTLFNRSLFERFLDAHIKPYFLNIQYRMAPMIRHFPSLRFYNDRLVDSESVVERKQPNFLGCFGGRNVIFVDIKYGREEKRGDSHINQDEGRVIGLLIKCLLDPNTSMGVITPYQAQRKVIMKEGTKELHANAQEMQMFENNIMVNTVDSFQGQERDVILVSTVRANQKRALGFLTDERRINVTLTRAKFVLIVVGNGDTLGSHEVWNSFLEWTQANRVYFQVKHPDELRNTMKKVFEEFNDKPITRKRYDHFTTDIRRIYRPEISSDFKQKKPHKSQEPPTDHKSPYPPPPSDPLAAASAPSKFARDIKQSQLIVEQKLRKQKQTEQFQQMSLKMQRLQQQMKDGRDDFYSQLFG